jgi:integrase
VPLPPNVFPVYDRRTGLPRYYWQRGRHRPKAERSALVRIPHDAQDPRFWAMAAELNGAPVASTAGTFAACISAYKASHEWLALADSTRRAYTRYLQMALDAWAKQPVEGLTARAVVAWRDKIASDVSGITANQASKTLNAFLKWCVPREGLSRNVAADVPPLSVDIAATEPWREDDWRYVVDHAPAMISRLAVLGRATGQRISDLVRMRPADRRADGIDLLIKKTRRNHWIAISPNEATMIDGWSVPPMMPYLHQASGARITEDHLRKQLREWVSSEAGKAVRSADLHPHGLRAMAVCDARLRGLEHQQIATLFGMSTLMVEAYSRRIDAERAGREARAQMDEAGTKLKTFPTPLKSHR